jgi:three-Cys-motif partner protein
VGSLDELEASWPSVAVPPWSQDKLDLLGKYLAAYSRIMQGQKKGGKSWLREYSYIDAFANQGYYVDWLSLTTVRGSPLVALDCEPPFDRYWFIERSPARMGRLKEHTSLAAAERKIEYRMADANDVLACEIARQITYERYERGFVFLDPYGLNVRWDTMRALAETRALDVFVNFPIMGINRILDRGRLPDEATLRLIEEVMGDADWVLDMYSSQPDLFGEEVASRPKLNAEELAAVYAHKLGALFGRCSNPVLMRNSTNSPLYALFLASRNPTAVKITNDIFKSFDRLRGTTPRRSTR